MTLWMCCGTLLVVRNLRHVHGSEKCVVRGRHNEFVMAGIACVAFRCQAQHLMHSC